MKFFKLFFQSFYILIDLITGDHGINFERWQRVLAIIELILIPIFFPTSFKDWKEILIKVLILLIYHFLYATIYFMCLLVIEKRKDKTE